MVSEIDVSAAQRGETRPTRDPQRGVPPSSARTLTLSAHEVELLRCLSAGLTNERIGARLFRSEKTVRNRLSGLYRKLGVANRAQAVAVFLRGGGLAADGGDKTHGA